MQLETLLPLALVLACPIGMLLMMRMAAPGKGGCHSAGGSEPAPARAESAEERQARLLEQRRAIDADLEQLRIEAGQTRVVRHDMA